MAVDVSQNICKFQKYGFCKFRDKCRLNHLFINCDVKDCKEVDCIKRHPKRCKYFFLRRFCKFGDSCSYSHDEETSKEATNLHLEIEKIKKKNKELEKDSEVLKQTNLKLQNELAKVKEEINAMRIKKAAIEEENKEVTQINENLIEDITELNERMEFLIPGKVEEEVLELREENAIQKCILEMYKHEGLKEKNGTDDEQDANLIDLDERLNEDPNVDRFSCASCKFTSTSQREINVHIGLKHKKKPSVS